MATRPEPAVIQTASALESTLDSSPIPSPSKASEFPQVIPDVASHKGRNLILCFDGTGDQFDQDNSNIVRFMQLLKKDDRTRQMVYYQAGIGTGIDTKHAGPISAKMSNIIDVAIATGLADHVRGGYQFLMQNYTEGDKISLFGFSRGAYTARALAGMLHKVGLLPAYNHEQVAFAYAMFKRDDPDGWKMSNGFKRAFSIDVKIDFLGVFDTVNSVGIIPRELPFAKSNYLIRVFRHAVALDERRAKFKANLWGRTSAEDEKLGDAGKRGKYHRQKSNGGGMWSYVTGGGKQDEEEEEDGEEHEHQHEDRKGKKDTSHHHGHDWSATADKAHQTDVKEVWFSGAHCDVGGGSVPNETPNNLARIPLRWMIRECFLNNTGILFHSSELDEIGISPASLWPVVKIPTPPVASDATAVEGNPPKTTSKLVPATPVRLGSVVDELDALCPIYDQLSIAKWWWILELLPMKQKYQRHDKSWQTWFSINFGGPRVIHGQKRFPTYVHRSVQYRMQQQPDYRPRAELLESPGPVWVD
ncbi:hypothetical protein BDV93DRAFT_535126 [Ceratobasidium sp. AG-I]|nr:hypothetical protein BDV93DRAFT_535126 [Ceratobasidium sp. AG-I]